MPGVSEQREPRREDLDAIAVALLLCVVVPSAIPTLVYGWRLERKHEWNRKVRHGVSLGSLIAAIGMVVLLGISRVATWTAEIWIAAFRKDLIGVVVGLARLALVGIPAGLAGGMLCRRWREHEERHHPVKGPRAVQERTERRMNHTAALVVSKPVPLTIDGLPVVGAWLDGDAEACRRGRWAVIPADAPHVVAIGASGSGKSTAIRQLVTATMLGDGLRHRVIFIDGKEELDMGIRLAQRAYQNGMPIDRIRLWPTSGPLDLWRYDTPQQGADLFHALAEWSESYYEAIARTAARLVFDDPRGAPRSFEEILGRLDATALKAVWAGTPESVAAASLNATLISGVHLRFHAISSALRNIQAVPDGRGGWAIEDGDLVHIALPSSTTPLVASGLGRALLLDLMQMIRSPNRRTDPRPILCVIEELGSIVDRDEMSARAVIEGMERSRSAGVRMILSGQTPASFGDPSVQERLLASGALVLATRMADGGEAVLRFLGTRTRPEASIGVASDGSMLDQGSLRFQEQFAVDPNAIRTMPTGRALLIHQGRWAMVQVPMS